MLVLVRSVEHVIPTCLLKSKRNVNQL